MPIAIIKQIGRYHALVCSKCGRQYYTQQQNADLEAWFSRVHPDCTPPKPLTATPPAPAHGPGTELKALLKDWLGIEATPTCSCNARARRMDTEGCDWCEANVDEIVGWLREEAGKRGLPFVDMAGRVLVRRAIRNARKEQARAQAAKEGTDKGGGSSV